MTGDSAPGTLGYAHYPDEQLMRLIRNGEPGAVDLLYERYSKRMLFFFYRMLGGHKEKAQDFLQDLFLKVIEKPELFNPDMKFATWLFAVAGNMCKNEYRRMSIRNHLDIESVPLSAESREGGLSQDDRMDWSAFQQELLTELETLSPTERSTFLLRYQEGLSMQEIGDVLQCPEGTVKSRLFNTTRKLASRLKHYHPQH